MDRELPLVEHLGELRKRIIISLALLVTTTALSLPLTPSLLKILKLPAKGYIDRLAFFSPEEAFLIYFKVGFLCALVVSMPAILYQVWAFISPAIEDRIKRYAVGFVLFSSAAFLAGGLFGYFILIPPALRFLLGFAGKELEPVISASKYISFMVSLIIGCGLVFEMPVLSLFLTKLGIINAAFLRKKYKYAIIAIVSVAAILTPTPDAFNMLLLTAPMLLLYELSVWVSYFAKVKR